MPAVKNGMGMPFLRKVRQLDVYWARSDPGWSYEKLPRIGRELQTRVMP